MNTVAVVGEVQTALLQTSAALTAEMATNLLRLLPGEPDRGRSRPVQIAWSPDLLTGVDCSAALPPTARRGRLVGTLRSTVAVIEGQMLQVATSTLISRSVLDRRGPWSHYMARPGMVELLGAVSDDDVATGFLTAPRARGTLDVEAVNTRLMGRVQKSAGLDRRAPFTARRTRMRWVARMSARDSQHADFTIGSDGVRTLWLEIPERLTSRVSEFCADLALHDWLLSSLRDVVDRALTGSTSRKRALEGLRPVIENLAHTWMPGTRVDDELAALWAELERCARLSMQWETAVTRVRDYVQFRLAEGLLAVSPAALGVDSTGRPGLLEER